MKLELFKFDQCPFCRRVMDYIETAERNDIIYCDTRKDPQNQERLVRIGGKNQVPCLLIDGKPLYESLDIIDWLEAHPEQKQ